MVIKDGRFGPYVTDGETNASLRKDDDVATITVPRAAELLADRRAAPPAKRSRTTTPRKKAAPRRPARAVRPPKSLDYPEPGLNHDQGLTLYAVSRADTLTP